MPEEGFKIDGKVFPVVTLDEWRNQDFVLARTLTRQPIEALVGPDGDRVLFQQAIVGVAVHHAQPELGIDRVIDYINQLKPTDIEEVGFDDEGDRRPPEPTAEEEAQPSSSFKTSEQPTDAIPEK
jgi:hypothetical protein